MKNAKDQALPDKDRLRLLPEDIDILNQRISELEEQTKNLGADFAEAFEQSSETWHDNAAFDAAREKQSLIQAELQGLWHVRARTKKVSPKFNHSKVTIGSRIVIHIDSSERELYLVGDFSLRTGQVVDSSLVVSAKSPIGLTLEGLKVGEERSFRGKKLKLLAIL